MVLIGAITEKVSFLNINAGYKCQILETHKYPAYADDPAIKIDLSENLRQSKISLADFLFCIIITMIRALFSG